MAGFALIFDRRGAPVETLALDALLSALDHRGPDGKSSVHLGHVALGHQHFWTTPESVGERQPLADETNRLWVLFDGRLDNREDLEPALGRSRTSSDAALILAAYRKWGDGLLERLLGAFALAIVDLERQRVVLGRDALGEATLFYHADASRAIVASEEQAILTQHGIARHFNERSLARFFGVEAPPPGETFFSEICELEPAHGLAFDVSDEKRWRHWAPDPERRLRYSDEERYVEEFRSLLQSAVRCRLRSASRPAILMSGGLDSTSIAAVAAEEWSAEARGSSLPAISWLFERTPAADERPFIAAMNAGGRFEPLSVPGDQGWPLSQPKTWPWDPNSPLQGLFHRLQISAYAATKQSGASVLLSGDGGDNLWNGDAYWLADLLSEGRPGAAVREIGRHCGPWVGTRPFVSLKAALARALGFRRSMSTFEPSWLTAHGLKKWRESPPLAAEFPTRRDRIGVLLDARLARAVALERGRASRCGVELRQPYRDRRLVEFCMALPAHQIYRPGWRKYLLRRAMRGVLPEIVRLRRWRSTLLPLAARGLVECEAQTVTDLLWGTVSPLWREYVRAERLVEYYPARLRAFHDGVEAVVPWRCVCAELWQRGWAKQASLAA